MALGKILKDAREAKGLSTTEVAEHTNMMVQIVQELENEDFHRIAAPIYGRGFLKLYAELLEIDVEPLIEEFMDIYTGKSVPAIRQTEPAVSEVKIPAARVVEESAEQDEAPETVPEPELDAGLNSVPEPLSEPEPVPLPHSSIPKRMEIVPSQAVRSLEKAPKPLDQTEPAPVDDAEAESLFAQQEEVGVEDESLAEDPVVAEADSASLTEPLSDAVPPAAGDDLFSMDEPNLFNTSPIQERLAEARRMMEEKEEDERDGKQKKTSLHLSPNQRLPVFQIGGRMDKTYEAEPRKRGSEHRSGGASFLGTVSRTFDRIGAALPFDLSVNRKSTFVYGALGAIILVFIVSGLMVIFKFTKAPAEDSGKSDPVPLERVAEKKAKPAPPTTSGTIPPPPDLYFD